MDRFQIDTFVSNNCWDKEKCMRELVDYLNKLGDSIRIIDIEKEWKIDNNLADYSPKTILEATIIYEELNL